MSSRRLAVAGTLIALCAVVAGLVFLRVFRRGGHTLGKQKATTAQQITPSVPPTSTASPTPRPSAHPTLAPTLPTPTQTQAAPQTAPPQTAPPPTGAPGARAVHVTGNQLVNASGAAFQLHGVNRSGTEYACVQNFGPFDGPSDGASVAAMWKGVNAVRVPLNEDCWLGINGYPTGGYTAAQYQQAIKAYVDTLHAHGLYAIVELHWSAPGAFQATWQEGMPDADHSPTFWSQVATTFKSDPATLFDLFNEPVGVDWPCWRDGCLYGGDPTNGRGQWPVAGMQSLVTAVRNTGATNVIMLGGLSFANDIAQWLTWKPSDPKNQLAASFHVYNFNTCNTTSCWDASVAPVAIQVPVVTGELGEDDGQATFINGYMAWADAKGLSYLAWTWDAWGCGGTVLIADYTGTACAGYGVGYKAHVATMP